MKANSTINRAVTYHDFLSPFSLSQLSSLKRPQIEAQWSQLRVINFHSRSIVPLQPVHRHLMTNSLTHLPTVRLDRTCAVILIKYHQTGKQLIKCSIVMSPFFFLAYRSASQSHCVTLTPFSILDTCRMAHSPVVAILLFTNKCKHTLSRGVCSCKARAFPLALAN